MTGQVLALTADYLTEPLSNTGIIDIIVIHPALITGIIRRIDIDALNPALILRQKCLECFQIIAVNDHIITAIIRTLLAVRTKTVLTLQHTIWHIKVIPAPSGGENWHRRTVESILTNEKYKGSALLQKKFTVDFLTKMQKVNEGDVPQYFIEDSHPPIIEPEEFELVQAEIARRKEIGKVYSSSNIFSTKLVCSCCGGFFGSKVWHSTSKYRRVIWQCNHKFQNGEKCKTPHLYEDEIKKRFIEVCNRIASDKEDFLISCQQIVEILSNTAALDRKIEAQYIYLNGLAVSMQEFIKENAMKPQGEDFYDTKLAEYEKQRAEGETRLKDLQSQKAARLSRKELLDGLVNALEESGILIDKFDERLWRLMVEKATVGTDGKLTFTLRNGMEIEV